MIPDAPHALQMMQVQPQLQSQLQKPPPCKEDDVSPPLVEDQSLVKTEPPVKKRWQGRQPKSPKPKKPKKAAVPRRIEQSMVMRPEGGELRRPWGW